jgi:transcriptional regulator with XRE-family HTH domain
MSDTPSNLQALREALGQHRLERHMSFERLARELNVTHVTVANFIAGVTEPHETTVYAVERYLKAQGVEVAA